MRMYDIIQKKADGGRLTTGEMEYVIGELSRDRLPDYQVAALLMAIYIRGMDDTEAGELTRIMAESGEQMDLSEIDGVKVDKHSTGGIGDKTTLVVGPLVAACGGTVAKMSGRGLGHTGGTIDKVEAMPGFRTSLSKEEFVALTNRIGFALTGQTANVAPADKRLYALRDVTATVASIPLIASSIMSKKLASGADKLLLDVKVGSGAFLKTEEEARKLAELMVSIGNANGRETRAILTNMDRPLGKAVGNLLELQESVAVLRGEGPEDLRAVCLELAAQMLAMSGICGGDEAACRKKAEEALGDGSAYAVFERFARAQGGDPAVIENPELAYATPACEEVLAWADGYLEVLSAEDIGKASVALGAGRLRKEDAIDMTAGLVFAADFGGPVKKGQLLCRMYTQNPASFAAAREVLKGALEIRPEKGAKLPLIFGVVE